MSIPSSRYAPVWDIFHHNNPTSAPSPLPGRDFEVAGSGVTAFQTTVLRDDSVDEKVGVRFVDGTARASGLFRKAASLRLGLGEIEDLSGQGMMEEKTKTGE